MPMADLARVTYRLLPSLGERESLWDVPPAARGLDYDHPTHSLRNCLRSPEQLCGRITGVSTSSCFDYENDSATDEAFNLWSCTYRSRQCSSS